MAELKDSGSRREFETGAVRDISEGKGRCDLLPLEEISEILNDMILKCINQFMNDGKLFSLKSALICFMSARGWDKPTMALELAKHFEDGARKYGERNWQKGLPLHCFIDSAVRHYLKWLRGDTDEPHDRAFVWNIVCAMWTVKNHPEMDDISEVSNVDY